MPVELQREYSISSTVFFQDKVSCSPGWPGIPYVTEGGFELPTLLLQLADVQHTQFMWPNAQLFCMLNKHSGNRDASLEYKKIIFI